jgi:hypothetical protein
MTNATWLFTWPLALMASTFDAWAQLFRQWQDATVKGLESILPAAAAAQLPQMACDAGAMPVRKEPDVLSNRDYDLSGEDRLKLVRFSRERRVGRLRHLRSGLGRDQGRSLHG